MFDYDLQRVMHVHVQHSLCLCPICLSVCLSVTLVICVKMANIHCKFLPLSFLQHYFSYTEQYREIPADCF